MSRAQLKYYFVLLYKMNVTTSLKCTLNTIRCVERVIDSDLISERFTIRHKSEKHLYSFDRSTDRLYTSLKLKKKEEN